MAAPDNKYPVSTTWGDSDPGTFSGNDNQEDFVQDSSGFTSDHGPSNKTDMNMALEPNKFPRDTGHDSLSGDEVIFS